MKKLIRTTPNDRVPRRRFAHRRHGAAYSLRYGVVAIGLGAFMLLSAAAAWAIVARQDCPDSVLLELGKKFPAVGLVLPDGGCTLIAPKWVVTAAHVAASLTPEQSKIQFANNKYLVKRVVLHPDAKIVPRTPPDVDIALVELDQPPEGVVPIPILRVGDELGKKIVIVGYGDIGNGRDVPKHTDGKRRAATNIVTDAGPLRLFCKFDEPPEGTELEGVSGPGDSGGPALIEVEGKFYVAGVSSASTDGKPGRYGMTDIYTRVSTQAKWIDQTVQGE